MSTGCHESAQFLLADFEGILLKKGRACLCVGEDRLFVFRLHSAWINSAVECVISFPTSREILRGRDSSTSP
jgi:hypothetical protein